MAVTLFKSRIEKQSFEVWLALETWYQARYIFFWREASPVLIVFASMVY